MKPTLRSIAPLAALCLVLVHAEAETFTWTGSVDGDWNNPANWDALGLPPVDLFGSLYGTENTITIGGGANSPTVNIPTIPSTTSESTGTPLFVVKSGGSLSLVSDTKAVFFPAQDKVAVTVESGGTLTFSGAESTSSREVFLSRTGGTQTHLVSGTLNFDADNLHIGYQFGRFTVISLDGGTLNFNGGTIFGVRSTGGNFTSDYNRIILDNGATFSAPTAAIRNTKGSEGGISMVVDIRDEESVFTFKKGRDFNSLDDVWNAIGTVFISSTMGNGNLVATGTDDGVYTVSFGVPGETFFWTGLTEYPDNWVKSPWYGLFTTTDYPLIWHSEHGFQFCYGTGESSIYFFDYNLDSWIWTSNTTYPFIYKLGVNSGWYWYYEGGTPGSRVFYSFSLGTDVHETSIND